MTDAFQAIAIYAGLLGCIAIWQGFAVGKVRLEEKVFMGDGGNLRVIRRMRGQANFVEFVPLILIFLIIMAAMGTPVWLLHLLGLVTFVSRFLHAWHFIQDDAPGWQRRYGTMGSALVLALCAVGLIAHGLFGSL